jgi:hemoglobin-like flavoprotein
MALNVELLQSSFELVVDRSPNFTERFYEILFERYPQVLPLFGRNAEKAQQEMLGRALTAVLDHLDDAPWLAQTLSAMGAKHVDYGVTPEMYPWVGDALIRTLAEISGNDWNSSVERAWAEAFAAISELMLAGTRPQVVCNV